MLQSKVRNLYCCFVAYRESHDNSSSSEEIMQATRPVEWVKYTKSAKRIAVVVIKLLTMFDKLILRHIMCVVLKYINNGVEIETNSCLYEKPIISGLTHKY